MPETARTLACAEPRGVWANIPPHCRLNKRYTVGGRGQTDRHWASWHHLTTVHKHIRNATGFVSWYWKIILTIFSTPSQTGINLLMCLCFPQGHLQYMYASSYTFSIPWGWCLGEYPSISCAGGVYNLQNYLSGSVNVCAILFFGYYCDHIYNNAT